MSSLTHADYLALRRFPALDGLRAIAAVLVVFFHYGGPDELQGWAGVQLFFVLSGFLITTLMLREEHRTGRISLKEFYLRRGFRILPVYFVVLLVTAVASAFWGTFSSNGIGPALKYFLTFTNEFAGNSPYGQSWSLGIEQKFYVVWPLVAIALGTLALRRRAGAVVLCMALALVLVNFTVEHNNPGWPLHYFSILTGVLLALALHSPRGFAVLRPLTNRVAQLVVCAGFASVHLSVKPIAGFLDGIGGIPGHVLVIPVYALAASVLLAALVAPGPATTALSTRPMQFVGERSYSLYLVQTIAATIIWYFRPELSGLGQSVAVTALGLVLASVLYAAVEIPMIDLGRRVIARGRRKAEPAHSPAAQPESRLATAGQAQP
ncbi:Peptidoglycan/LPS O-acetylase OafA/YrhL, contains acyltransferase and SGNH-hydrolase domains [Lentzea fradiae]|uniref:Peptidoglycan/LPS O-acetylase OafA/YrhL, contains acyltransferase and SGNH-hydrolase domains n=1 Tax=Lentzea fradiae TaxID=200378 RepID=A0A1G7TMC4_9PSEU|nr:acyltransferase [Lentzea fradiae]SDG36262.1 Peptidoglycan/LPS O-acetylase OafA/YrhL, contains acyltransferase and SGNH-hydrolase domains [Lentzea fradiae]